MDSKAGANAFLLLSPYPYGKITLLTLSLDCAARILEESVVWI